MLDFDIESLVKRSIGNVASPVTTLETPIASHSRVPSIPRCQELAFLGMNGNKNLEEFVDFTPICVAVDFGFIILHIDIINVMKLQKL